MFRKLGRSLSREVSTELTQRAGTGRENYIVLCLNGRDLSPGLRRSRLPWEMRWLTFTAMRFDRHLHGPGEPDAPRCVENSPFQLPT